MAYALLADRISAQVMADRQLVAVYQAAGAKGAELPEVATALEAFDAALIAEPRPVAPDAQVLREALGLRRAG